MLESDETYDESSPVPESMMQEKQTEVAVEAQPSASDADESNDNEAREAGVEGEPNSDGASEEAIPKWKLLWMVSACIVYCIIFPSIADCFLLQNVAGGTESKGGC